MQRPLRRAGRAGGAAALRARARSTRTRGGSSSTSRRCARSRPSRDARPELGGRAARGAQPLLQRERPRDPRARSTSAATRRTRTSSPRSATRTSTPRGCGRSPRPTARRCARSRPPAPLHGRVPRVPLRLLAGAAVRVDRGARPRAVGARAREGRARASSFRSAARWVEPDCNIPSGESLVRQFLHGQRFFEREFGRRCREFWSPDAFGYTAQLPQLMREAGITRFLTQKLSWNRFNRAGAPHVRVAGDRRQRGARRTSRRPTRTTQRRDGRGARSRSARDVQGSRALGGRACSSSGTATAAAGRRGRCSRRCGARATCRACRATTHRDAATEFFDALEAEPAERPVVVGELYFEYHRGTYTSQARTKRGNRRCEQALHDAEFLAGCAAAASIRAPSSTGCGSCCCSSSSTTSCPGSSIRLVYEDARARPRRGRGGRGRDLRAARATAGQHDRVRAARGRRADRPATLRRRAPPYGARRASSTPDDAVTRRRPRARERAPARGCSRADGTLVEPRRQGDAAARRSPRRATGSSSTTTGRSRSTRGTSIRSTSRRDATARPADVVAGVTARAAARRGRVRAGGRRGEPADAGRPARRGLAAARVPHRRRLAREPHAAEGLLPARRARADARRTRCRSATPSGRRTTRRPRDRAQYEVPGHRWADLSEHGFGAALLTDCKYGYSCHGNELRISLLRAPKSPDPEADMGRHAFAYALLPHAGGWRDAGVVGGGDALQRAAALGAAAARRRSFARGRRSRPRPRHDQARGGLRRARAAALRGARRPRRRRACGSRFPFESARRANALEDDGEALAVATTPEPRSHRRARR